MTPPRPYARRRRAAVPAALAAFVLLLVITGSSTPATWAGEVLPAMTIVLPPQVVSAPAPAEVAALPEPPSEPLPLDDSPDVAASATSDDDSTDDSATSGGDSAGKQPADEQDETDSPAIRHVVLIVLAQTDLVALADDATAAPYLAGELVPQGTLLTRYDSIARGSLANGIALVSGQGPTAQTLADCPTAAGAAPADVTPDVVGDDGQQVGDGCVYPYATGTVADQLTGAGKDWRAYVEGAASACPATPRDPFASFHSLLDGGACASSVTGLDRLDADLARGRRAPALLYVVPDACHDGRPQPCAPDAPAGGAAADAFLSDVVPRILASPAYVDGGLIAITSDGPPQPAPEATAPPAPPPATAPQPVPPPAAAAAAGAFPASYPNVGDAASAGAARVGALLISATVRAGATNAAPANHFTLLRSISDLFALQPLGYAGSADAKPLPEAVLPRSGEATR